MGGVGVELNASLVRVERGKSTLGGGLTGCCGLCQEGEGEAASRVKGG